MGKSVCTVKDHGMSWLAHQLHKPNDKFLISIPTFFGEFGKGYGEQYTWLV